MKRKAADLKAGSGADALLRIAFPHSITTTMLPGVLVRFFQSRPNAVVETLSAPDGAIDKWSHSRSADFGFCERFHRRPSF